MARPDWTGLAPLALLATAAIGVIYIVPRARPVADLSPQANGVARAEHVDATTRAIRAEKTRRQQRSGILKLADPAVAQQLGLAPERRRKVAAIVADLNARLTPRLYAAVNDWSQTGGLQSGRLPDFLFGSSALRFDMERIKDEAEREAFALLTEEERQRWIATRALRPAVAQRIPLLQTAIPQ